MREERRFVPLLLGALGVLLAAGTIGAAMAPVLAVEAPLALVALSPLGRHLVLVAPVTPIVPFVAVAVARRLLAMGVVYGLGRAYGEDGFVWVERRYARFGRFVRLFERFFRKAAPVAILLLPGWSAPVAGLTRTSPLLYFPLAAVGLTGWMIVTYQVGDALSAWITPMLAFIREHVVSTTAACAALVLLYEWRRRRRRPLVPEAGDAPASEP